MVVVVGELVAMPAGGVERRAKLVAGEAHGGGRLELHLEVLAGRQLVVVVVVGRVVGRAGGVVERRV